MGAYLLALHFWRMLGSSEFDLRLLSALFAVAAIGVVARLGRALFDDLTGLIAGGLLLTNLFWLGYAQEARGYSLALLLTALATLLLQRGLARPSWPTCIAYAACILAGAWTHYFVLLVLLVHSLSLLWRRHDRRVGLFVRRTAAMLAAAFVLLASYAFVQYAPFSFENFSWTWTPGITDLLWLFRLFAGGQSVSPGVGVSATTALVLVAVGVGLGGAAVVLSPRDRGAASVAEGEELPAGTRRWSLALLLLWILLPVMTVFVFSVAIKPLFVDRYFIVCLPAAVLLMARGLALLIQRARLLGVVVSLIVIGLTIPGHLHWYGSPPKQDWRSATRWVAGNATAKDAVLFADSNETRGPFDYYWGRLHPGFVMRRGIASIATVNRVLAGVRPPVVWIVLYTDRSDGHNAALRTAQALSSSQYQVIADRVFPGTYDRVEVAVLQDAAGP
jgi:uncharacterized membrane protein